MTSQRDYTQDYPYRWSSKPSGTVVNCEEEGHCWHGGTAVGSLYCCKCGKYWQLLSLSKQFPQWYYPQI